MIILPDRKISHSKILKPVLKREWKTSSVAQRKDEFGNENRTCFKLKARLNDGFTKWTGWFEDRDDFDAFLWSLVKGTLKYERELWDLSLPNWDPDIGKNVTYEFATVTILTTSGSNQTYTSPSDWNNSDNSVQCIGGGASGGGYNVGNNGKGTGGGGGAYSKITNFSFATPGTTTATYRVGALVNGTNNAAGTNGNSTWFNNTVNPGNGTTNSQCSAAGGSGGLRGTTSTNGGAGGSTSASWGQTKYAGGRGGNLTGTPLGSTANQGSGGGGAGGPNGNGNNGEDSAGTGGGITDGGDGGAGFGGAGGVFGLAGSAGNDLGNGVGSGGGGSGVASITIQGASGGSYGGGGGGICRGDPNQAIGGNGRQGIIVITYVPANINSLGNLPMLGM